MRFIVTRTSEWDNDKAPCPEAVITLGVRVDERRRSTPEQLSDADTWYTRGRNHRVENGHIMRDFDDKRWTVELSTLEELLAFSGRYGELVVSRWHTTGYDLWCIEIYDTHRE